MADAAADDDLVDLVKRQVVPLVDWYQRKKRWPRRLHRVTTATVIVLGAAIPLLTLSDTSSGTRWAASVVGVTISGLTGLATVCDWQRRWRIFTNAQTALEVKLATWELAILEASTLQPSDRSQEMRVAATRELLAAAGAIRQGETEEFFASQLTPTPAALRGPPAV